MNRVSLLLLPLACAACAQDAGRYPSLAVRPAEGTGFAEPAAPPVTAVVADPALDAAVAKADATREKAAAAFDAAERRAATLVAAARGGAAGSEPWIEAQVAIAELDGLRAEGVDVLTGLEDLATTRASGLAADYPALTQAQERARQITQAQRLRIDALTRQLPAA